VLDASGELGNWKFLLLGSSIFDVQAIPDSLCCSDFVGLGSVVRISRLEERAVRLTGFGTPEFDCGRRAYRTWSCTVANGPDYREIED
jgi:hypothetical protein